MPKIHIIGAGIAGVSTAVALAKRNITSTLYTGKTNMNMDATSAASYSPAAICIPYVQKTWNPAARFYASAFHYLLRELADLTHTTKKAPFWHPTGVKHIANGKKDANWQRGILEHYQHHKDIVRSSEHLGEPCLYYPNAGWIDGQAYLHTQLARYSDYINVDNSHIEGLDVLDSKDTCVIAGGAIGLKLLPDMLTSFLEPMVGQLIKVNTKRENSIHPEATATILRQALCYDGYAVNTGLSEFWLGSTYEKPDKRLSTEEARQQILMRFCDVMKVSKSDFEVSGYWQATRVTVRDRMPLLGKLGCGPPSRRYILTGLGSKGMVMGPLLGEALACMIMGEAVPLECAMINKISPARFLP